MHKFIRDGVEVEINSRLPVLPLKEEVVFPYITFPLLVGRETSLQAVHEALMLNRVIFLAAQKDLAKEAPERDDLHRVGVVARILQVLKLPNVVVKVLVEGLIRGRINRFVPAEGYFETRVDILPENDEITPEVNALRRRAAALSKEYIHINRNLPNEVLFALENFERPSRLADFMAAPLQREMKTKQHILENDHYLDVDYALSQVLFITTANARANSRAAGRSHGDYPSRQKIWANISARRHSRSGGSPINSPSAAPPAWPGRMTAAIFWRLKSA